MKIQAKTTSELIKKLNQYLQKPIEKALSDTGEQFQEQLKKIIQTEVYDAYPNPVSYKRTYEFRDNGAVLDTSKIKDKIIKIRAERESPGMSPYEVPQIIETGEGYDPTAEKYMSDFLGYNPPARPFFQTFIESIKEDPKTYLKHNFKRYLPVK